MSEISLTQITKLHFQSRYPVFSEMREVGEGAGRGGNRRRTQPYLRTNGDFAFRGYSKSHSSVIIPCFGSFSNWTLSTALSQFSPALSQAFPSDFPRPFEVESLLLVKDEEQRFLRAANPLSSRRAASSRVSLIAPQRQSRFAGGRRK